MRTFCRCFGFVYHPSRCQFAAPPNGVFAGLLWSLSSLFPLRCGQYHCSFCRIVFFCVVTSLFAIPGLLTTHVRLSLICVHGFQTDTSKNGSRLHLLLPQRGLWLMTSRKDTQVTTQTRVRATDMPTNSRTKRHSSLVSSGADSQYESDGLHFPYGTQKLTHNRWCLPNDPLPTPPGLPSTPQSSWQPYSDTNTTRSSWGLPSLCAWTT